MSDETTSAGGATPAAPAIAAPVVAAPAAVVAPAVTPPATPAVDTSEPAWLPARLQRAEASARAAVLSELGVTNADEAKAAVAAAKAAADAKKTAEERAAELATQLNATKTAAERQQGLFKELSGRMFMALTPEQQSAVKDFAGDDPEKQYLAIKHFGPTWAAAEQAKEAAAQAAQAAAVAAAAAAPKAAPAQTSAAPAAPSSETPTASSQDPKSLYQSARVSNPFAAAAYGLRNPSIYDTK